MPSVPEMRACLSKLLTDERVGKRGGIGHSECYILELGDWMSLLFKIVLSTVFLALNSQVKTSLAFPRIYLYSGAFT